MTSAHPVVALVRTSALPLSWITMAGTPELAAARRRWDRDHHRLAAEGTRLADLIGAELVPAEAIGAAGRAAALTARRLLHALPDPVPATAAGVVATSAELAERAGHRALARDLSRTAAALGDLAERHSALDDAVAEEHRRLLALPWSLIEGSPVARLAVAEANAGALADIVARLAAGESWTTKRMRQRSDFLWRLLIRGTTRATPRGWLAHTGLLATDPAEAPAPPPDLNGDHAVEYAANRHDGAVLAGLSTPDTLVAVAPLHHDNGADMTFWVLDAQDPNRLRELRLRRTDALHAVVRALAAGPRELTNLLDALVPDGADARVRAALHGFVEHLVSLGVVTASLPSAGTVTGWSPRPDELPAPPEGSYVDVHRRADRRWSLAAARQVEDLVEPVLRVLRVIDPDPVPVAGRTVLTEEPRPVLDLLSGDLTARDTGPHRHDWPLPDTAGAGYRRLHAWLTDRLDAGPVDLDAAPLGPAPQPLTWPVDCVVRPLWQDGGPLAVLDHLQPTGTLDSRFADALAALHPDGRARPDWYREFLRHVESALGGRFVELLVPALSDRAANAIRRPAYTSAWTGDPDLARYYRDGPDRPGTYLPLSALTIRLADGRPVVESRGDRIWPVYHATRVMPPPWHVIGPALLAASPRAHRQHWRALQYSLGAWPDRDHVPRFTVGGGRLVLTPAQWRLPVARLWPAGAGLPEAARTLTRLCTALGLPRWVTVVADGHEEPRACDLESLHAVRLLDRVRRTGTTELLLAEMLPAPDARAHHTELVLRLPLTADPAELAAVVAAEHRQHSLTG